MSSARARSLRFVAALITAALAAACDDPVHDQEIAALGPEAPGVPPGPLHRPGQPCLVCHDGTGPASLVFGTAGTVFQDAMSPTPLVAATVKITDVDMKVFNAETNCAGNFFIEAVDFTAAMPAHVEVDYGGMSAQMLSNMTKGDSCAACHTGTVSSSSVAQVFLNQDPMTYPPSGCP